MTETIKLLDGSVWDKKELIKNMDNDDFYYNECGKKMLSSSICKTLLDSYKRYYLVNKYGQKESQPLRDGWLFHTAILEPNLFGEQLVVDVQSKNTKMYKEALEAAEEEKKGTKVFTLKEIKNAEKLADAFLKNSKLVQYLNKAQFEVPIAGEVMGMPFRGKADIISKEGWIIDLKTTTSISKFRYSADTYCYDLQCYIYCHLFGVSYKDFKFIAIDKDSTVAEFFNVSESFYLKGQDKCAKAIKEYKQWHGKDLDEYLKFSIL